MRPFFHVLCLTLALSPGLRAFEVSVSPSKREFSLGPGAYRKSYFRISNKSRTETLKIRVSTADISQSKEGNLGLADPGTTPWSASGWISFPAREIRLAPGQETMQTFEIRVPSQAAGGGYAAIVAESTAPAPDHGGHRVINRLRVPCMIYVSVPGTARPRARLVETSQGKDKDGNPVFRYALANDGNAFFRPRGTLTADCGGKKVDFSANPRSLGLMPGATRAFEVRAPEGDCRWEVKLEDPGRVP